MSSFINIVFSMWTTENYIIDILRMISLISSLRMISSSINIVFSMWTTTDDDDDHLRVFTIGCNRLL